MAWLNVCVENKIRSVTLQPTLFSLAYGYARYDLPSRCKFAWCKPFIFTAYLIGIMCVWISEHCLWHSKCLVKDLKSNLATSKCRLGTTSTESLPGQFCSRKRFCKLSGVEMKKQISQVCRGENLKIHFPVPWDQRVIRIWNHSANTRLSRCFSTSPYVAGRYWQYARTPSTKSQYKDGTSSVCRSDLF